MNAVVNVTPIALDFDSEIAGLINRMRADGWRPETIEASENYLIADAEFTAAMREVRS